MSPRAPVTFVLKDYFSLDSELTADNGAALWQRALLSPGVGTCLPVHLSPLTLVFRGGSFLTRCAFMPFLEDFRLSFSPLSVSLSHGLLPDTSSLRLFHIAMETDVMSVLDCRGLSDHKLIPCP